MSSINTSKKGAVSVQTTLDKAIAQHKLALQAQQANTKVSTLIKANDSINAQLTSTYNIPSNDLFPSDRASATTMEEQIAAYNKVIIWEQNIVTDSDWGANYTLATPAPSSTITNTYNRQIHARVGTSSYSGTLSSPDKALLNSDITYLLSQTAKIQAKVNSLKAALTKNNNLINNNTKTLFSGTSAKTVPPAQPQTQELPPENPPDNFMWNLPPHAWSLPVDPYDIAPDTTNKRLDHFHQTRRGRIWMYQPYLGTTTTGTPTTASSKKGKAAPPPTTNNYGFQFIWNPETFSQDTSTNSNITTSASDPSAASTGFVTGNSSLTFTLRLDRTNDFASMKAGTPITSAIAADNINNTLFNKSIGPKQKLATLPTEPEFDSSWLNYYKIGTPSGSDTNIEQKIIDLLTYGTEADLEYLYASTNGKDAIGIGGKITANIGYLKMAYVRVDLGQQKFVGVLSDVSVNHLAFTRDMIPIRTDVNITIDLRVNTQMVTNSGLVGN